MKYTKKAVSVFLCVIFVFSFAIIALADEHVHQYTATPVYATCTEQGYTLYVCDCGESYKDAYVDPTGHSYGGWDAIQKTTCQQEGRYIRTCKECGAAQTKTVPMLDHYDGNRDGKCDTCGCTMEVESIYSPFDWFMDLFKTIFGKIKDFFAMFSK